MCFKGSENKSTFTNTCLALRFFHSPNLFKPKSELCAGLLALMVFHYLISLSLIHYVFTIMKLWIVAYERLPSSVHSYNNTQLKPHSCTFLFWCVWCCTESSRNRFQVNTLKKSTIFFFFYLSMIKMFIEDILVVKDSEHLTAPEPKSKTQASETRRNKKKKKSSINNYSHKSFSVRLHNTRTT